MKINTVNKFAYFFFGLIDCIIYILNVQKNLINIRFSANFEVRLNDKTTGHPLPCHETSV